MKNKFFSLKLYIETMRQLRLPAWIITGIICVITATTDFIIAIDGGYGERLPSIMEFAPGLWGFMYIAPLVFTIMSFGFLNSRSDSDFYHSLPNTRQSLYISRIAAVMTMTFGGILSTCIVSLLGRLIWQLPINMMSYFYIILFSTAASMVITGGVALAMSITGTKLSNAVATLLIVYFPRCILFILAAFMENVAPVLVTSSMGMLFSFRYNLAFAPIGLLEMGEDIMTFWPGILYSIVLSVIYAALGLWAFVRRRSETADKAAPSKKLHRVYAIALARTLGAMSIVTDDTKIGGPHATLMRLPSSDVIPFSFCEVLFLLFLENKVTINEILSTYNAVIEKSNIYIILPAKFGVTAVFHVIRAVGF